MPEQKSIFDSVNKVGTVSLKRMDSHVLIMLRHSVLKRAHHLGEYYSIAVADIKMIYDHLDKSDLALPVVGEILKEAAAEDIDIVFFVPEQ